MPVGAAGVGAARLAFASTLASPSGVGDGDGEATLVFATEVSGSVAASLEVSSTVAPRIIATNATVEESGDHRIVSGKCTAIASDVTFFRSRPSAVYMSNRNSFCMSPDL